MMQNATAELAGCSDFLGGNQTLACFPLIVQAAKSFVHIQTCSITPESFLLRVENDRPTRGERLYFCNLKRKVSRKTHSV